MGGPGPMAQERKLLKQFDKNDDGRLDAAERTEARAFIKENPGARRGPGGPGSRGGPGGRQSEPTSPGPRVETADVKSYPDADLYDTGVLRTIFLQFESDDWEAELADFYNTDVEVPATLTCDGVAYPHVGVHFRGASSFFMVPAGGKRSLNVSMDFVDSKQRLHGARTLNLLNSHGDPSFLSSVLFSQIAREHIVAPLANFARVVINGESWGLYVNVEQFNADYVKQHFKDTTGKGDAARWKVKGSPNGSSGLDYIGDDADDYKRRYQIKSKDDPKAWSELINLCHVITETPLDELEEALKPILDIDSVLWFLALDITLANSDGYWTRASDYSIYKDPAGVFHVLPHDMNEAFSTAMGGPGFGPGGPGGRRGPEGDADRPPPPPRDDAQPAEPRRPEERAGRQGGGRRGAELDPLAGLDDSRKPLRSRLLAVPSLRARYLEHVRELAEQSLDWNTIGPVIAQHRSLIEEQVKIDTRKSSSLEAFERMTSPELPAPPAEGARPASNLRAFLEQRRAYLLAHPEIAKLAAPSEPTR
jgi:hypothetical protein